MSNRIKRLPTMEDYKKVHYYNMPVYHENKETELWLETNLDKSDCFPFGIAGYSLSPDKQCFFITSWDSPYSTDFTEPVVFETHPFKCDADLGFKVKRNPTLWLYHCATKELICLLDGSISFAHPIWKPDSTGILYQTADEHGLLCFYEISILAKDKHKPEQIVSASNVIPCLENKSGIQFSADGTNLVFAANRPGDEFADPPSLYRIPVAEKMTDSIPAVDLIHPDYNLTGVVTNGYPFLYKDNKTQSFQVLPDNRCIYIAPKDGSLRVFQVPVTEEGHAIPSPVTDGTDNFHTLTYAGDSNVLSIHTSPVSLPEIVLLNVDTGEFTYQTQENAWTNELLLQPAKIHWIGESGTPEHTQGFFIPPYDVDPNKKYPAILYCHGGPTGFYSTALDLEFQSLAAAGFAVIYANPRGSTGYGSIHSADEDAYNGNASSDLENFVQEMCRLYPYIDQNRLGVCGGSYGGYMTSYLASHNKMFKAASAHRPLLNWQMIGYASHSAGCMHTRNAFPDFADYIKECLDISPTTYGQQIQIPFQIQQGIRDANCIPEQVYQLYTTIRNFNPDVPCRMILYPETNHLLLSRGPIEMAIQHRLDNLEWFKKWL